MTSGPIPSRAMAARYPEAPACPTDAYSSAVMKNRMARIRVLSTDQVLFAYDQACRYLRSSIAAARSTAASSGWLYMRTGSRGSWASIAATSGRSTGSKSQRAVRGGNRRIGRPMTGSIPPRRRAWHSSAMDAQRENCPLRAGSPRLDRADGAPDAQRSAILHGEQHGRVRGHARHLGLRQHTRRPEPISWT